MSISDILLKIKPLGILILKIACIILLLGLVFSLGRISALSQNNSREPLQILYPPLVKTAPILYGDIKNAAEPESWMFAGSKTGKTYYPKGCSGLTRVKLENRVYFSTTQEAENAGYHISTTCK